jgi:hypothetical protein
MQVYANRNNLVQAILEALKVVAYGQQASAIEIDAVDKDLDGALLELNARGISPVLDPDTIPVEYLNALSQACGRMMANKFSIGADELELMFGKESDVLSPENRLRAMKNTRPAYVPMTPDYF